MFSGAKLKNVAFAWQDLRYLHPDEVPGFKNHNSPHALSTTSPPAYNPESP